MIATPGVSNSVVSSGTIDGVANPGGLEWMSQFLSLAASNSPQYTFQAISMHWYGSPSLTVEENGALLEDQAGAMMQLAADKDIPEVWITEMGSGYGVDTASEDVSLAPSRHQSPVASVVPFNDADIVASSVNSFNGSKALL